MARIHVEREVAAPADRVWSVMTDLERTPEVISGVQAVERLDAGDRFGTGTRWRETRLVMGRESTEEMHVTEVDPGRSYTVEADSRGSHYVSVLAVEPLGDDRSRASMRFEVSPTGLVARIMAATVGRLLQGTMRKGLAQDLDDIAFAAERTR